MSNTAGIIVNVINNLGSGSNITFSSLSFLDNTHLGFSPQGYPPVVSNFIPGGTTSPSVNILTAGYGPAYWVDTSEMLPIVAGTAVFNLPDGETFTITWDVASYDNPSKVNPPTISPSSNTYNFGSGLAAPTVSPDGYLCYTFDLTITS